MADTPRNTASTALTAVVVIGLAIDAVVHFHLASAFSANRTRWLSEPTLFRAEAVASLVALIALLVRRNRYTILFAFLLAASGTLAVVFYRYVDLGVVGPVPNMYDPYWAPPEKVLSAVAEALAALAALALLTTRRQRSGRRLQHDRA
jgi:FtsH-binding integral membrane protein